MNQFKYIFNNDRKNLLLILLAAVIVRFWGITYGLPVVYNSTEYFIAKHALSFGARMTLEPLFYIYPTFFTYLIAGLYAVYFIIGLLAGTFQSPEDFAFQFIANPYGFYLSGRILVSVFIIITSLVFYKAVRLHTEPKYGFYFSLLFLFTYNIHYFTRWMVPDALLIFGTVWVFYYILKWQRFGLQHRNEILFPAVLAGLTISSKYNAGFLAFSLLSAIWLYRNYHSARWKSMALGALGTAGGFLLGSPYWLIEFSKFREGFLTIWSQSRYAYNFTTGSPYLWELREIVQTEFLLGILMWGAIVFSLMRWKKEYLPFLIAILPTFLVVGSWEKKGLDYILILFPITLLLVMLVFLHLKNQRNLRIFKILGMIVLIPSMLHIAYFNFLHSQTDTRQKATAWIMENIPSGTAICYDHYHYDLNLIDVKRFTEYGQSAHLLSEEIKAKIEGLEKSPRNYRFISPLHHLEVPRWPSAWDSLTIESLGEDPFLADILKHPVKSLSEIMAEGAEWLILNSDSYLKFLQNPPPSADNPLREDFLKKVEFYQTVFEKYKPVQIFEPDWKTPGPVIQIFHLK